MTAPPRRTLSTASPRFNQTTWCADRVIEFLREQQSNPWFFSYNCFTPHHPFDPPGDYLARYNPGELPLPKIDPREPDGKTSYQQLDAQYAHNDPGGYHVVAMSDRDKREVTAAYYAMVELIDENVGRMIAALEETGQLKNTIVIFMSDHGEMLGDHGIYLKGPHFYEAAAYTADHAMARPVSSQPTCRRADGTHRHRPLPARRRRNKNPNRHAGQTLLPILQGTADPHAHRDYVFSEYYNAWSHCHSYGTMYRTETHKMIVYGTDQGELKGFTSRPKGI